MLHRELEHCGVACNRGMDRDNSRTEAIGPSLCTLFEKVMKISSIVDLDVATLLAISQSRQDVLVNVLDVEKAIVDRGGWYVVRFVSLFDPSVRRELHMF